MFELPQQQQPYQSDYLANQTALGNLFKDRATNYMAQEEAIRKDITGEAALPETLLKSKLGALQTQGKINTFDQEEDIRKQNLTREQKFNSLRALNAMMDDPSLTDDDLREFAVGAVKMIAEGDPNYNKNAKLADARRSAVYSHLEEAARQNPRGIRGVVQQGMKNWAIDMPTQNKIVEQDNQGYNTEVNTLLKGQLDKELEALRAGNASKERYYQWSQNALSQMYKNMNDELRTFAQANSIPLLTGSLEIDPNSDMVKVYKDGELDRKATAENLVNLNKMFVAAKNSISGKYEPRIRQAEAVAEQTLEKAGFTNTNTTKPNTGVAGKLAGGKPRVPLSEAAASGKYNTSAGGSVSTTRKTEGVPHG